MEEFGEKLLDPNRTGTPQEEPHCQVTWTTGYSQIFNHNDTLGFCLVTFLSSDGVFCELFILEGHYYIVLHIISNTNMI